MLSSVRRLRLAPGPCPQLHLIVNSDLAVHNPNCQPASLFPTSFYLPAFPSMPSPSIRSQQSTHVPYSICSLYCIIPCITPRHFRPSFPPPVSPYLCLAPSLFLVDRVVLRPSPGPPLLTSPPTSLRLISSPRPLIPSTLQ